MLIHYIKLALRNLRRNKLLTFINITGLALSIAVCLLIGLWSYSELKFDAFHEKGEKVLLFQQNENNSGSGSGFASLIEREISQVEESARLLPTKALLTIEDDNFNEDKFYFADPEIFEILTLPLVAGVAKQALDIPFGIIISEKAAFSYFQDQDPIGKIIRFENKQDLVVTGVLKNLPDNSHLQIDFLLSSKHAEELLGEQLNGYWDNRALTYLLMSKSSSAEMVTAKLPAVKASTNDQNSGVWKLAVISLRDIYLYHTMDNRVRAHNGIEKVYLFTTIAFLVLVLACFNYINLATARASTKALEVGVRKTTGASRFDLLFQFLIDSIVNILIAAGLAVLIAFLLLPFFNILSGRILSLSALLDTERLYLIISGLAILCLLTGSYPSVVLSSFKPVESLKNNVLSNNRGINFRKILVVGQFGISAIMIVATLIVFQQFNYMQNKDLGYNQEQILTISFQGKTQVNRKLSFKHKLQTLAGVDQVSLSSSIPGSGSWFNKLVVDYLPAGVKDAGIQQIFVDENFLETYNIALARGRNFRPEEHKAGPVYMINEAAQRFLQWEDVEGKNIGYYTYEYSQEGGYQEVPQRGPVVGVVKDYHQGNLKSLIQPLLIVLNPETAGQMAVKLQSGDLKNQISSIKKSWENIFPDQPFEYAFMDDDFDQTYKEEIRTGKIISIFAGFAIVLSCMGLFGLAAFTTQQRTKEVGIRKVLGASVKNIVVLLSKDFVKLVLMALLIASPIAWYFMNDWLQDFAYRINIGWYVFAVAGITAVGIALITVSFHAIKAATGNPVENIRTE